MNNHIYRIGCLQNGFEGDIHISGVKFYHDGLLKTDVVMPHVFDSRPGVVFQLFNLLYDLKEGSKVQVY